MLCAGDNQGLSQSVQYTLVNSCSAQTKCEAVCETGYHLDATSGVCVQDTGSEYTCTTNGWLIGFNTTCSPLDPAPNSRVLIGATLCLANSPDSVFCPASGNGNNNNGNSNNNGSGCFIKGTQVTMADGSTKNIEEVKIGDKIRGNSGINTVLGFHRPILEGDLYSFNGGDYFVNDDHPFMTTDGWKSLNPAKTALIHGLDLNTTLLKEGDIMITDKGEIKLEKISRKSVLGSTQLYNFNLDGDHTYYADGYLVHNKLGWTSNPCLPANGGYATIPGCSLGGTVANVTYQTQCANGGQESPEWDCVQPGYYDYHCSTTTCFVADTKVIMADGTTKNIQDVKIGEYVKGAGGEISEVKNVHMPKLGERRDNKVYSFNGGRYFVTAEHPFMTTDGWKAIDPVWSMEEHPKMSAIGYLKEGDTLITEDGEEVIKSIEFKEYAPETQLYNLMLGGNHTYFADGYLVHNLKCVPACNSNSDCGTGNLCCNNACVDNVNYCP